MPHATYCFLINTDDLLAHSENLSFVNSEDAEFRAPVDAMFEPWRREHCNVMGILYHTHLALLMNDGRVVQFIQENDWRGRSDEVHLWRDDKDATASIFADETHPERNAWLEKIYLYAYRCAALGMFRYMDEIGSHVPDDIRNFGLDLVKEWFEQRLPRQIAELYNSAAEEGVRDEEASRQRRRLVEAYEAFRSAEIAPFSTRWMSPEKYRCFDLRSERTPYEDVSKLAYLLTDIHTP
jgi:hypothetical protein